MKNFLIMAFLAFSMSISGAKYYVATDGHDANGNGSKNFPYFSLEKAWGSISAGDTIYMRGGQYKYSTRQDLIGKNGRSGYRINIWAYPGELPIITKSDEFDLSGQTHLIYIDADYLYLKGLEISYFQQKPGIKAASALFCLTSNSIFENLNYHHNALGMFIRENSSNNLILNCDFHNNYDPYDELPYNHADGLDLSDMPSGTVNTVKGCRFYENADDGLDLWNNNGKVLIENCWAWRNGYREDGITTGGDGSGLKLGMTSTTDYTDYKRILTNNLSVSNRTLGISQNSAFCKIFICNNTLYDNREAGIYFSPSWGDAAHLLKNNIAYKNYVDAAINIDNPIVDHNSWQPGYNVTDSDFLNLDPAQLASPRKADGSLPDITFMHLATGSDLIDAGINVGLPFSGLAPDIGTFETAPTSPVVVNQKPIISISSPSKSASFTSPASITINAIASDPDGSIIKVEFYQGTVKIGEKVTSPYSVTWKEVPEGTYSLTAVATDNKSSKTVSAAVSISVAKPATPVNKSPTVSIASPTKGNSYTAPASITIDINASDPDGSITKVELFNGAVKLEERTSSPYSFTLKDLPAGTYNLKAVATDNLKATAASSLLEFTVTAYIEARDYFNLYPNPNDGRFSIEFTSLLDADTYTVTVVDLIGKTVYREELSKDESTRQFDLSHLNSGIYILMIAADQILLAQKFIKG